MKISTKGLEFIAEFEGCYLNSYKDQAGIWTIGIGTIKYPNGKKVSRGDTCSIEEAERWLEFELGEKSAYFNKVLMELNLKLSQCEFDALLSFFYNVGIGKCYEGTTMGDAIYARSKYFISDAFLVYNKYTWLGIKRVSKGLDRRRKAEKALFEDKYEKVGS